MMETRPDHWGNVYTTKADDSVSWVEQVLVHNPRASL